MDNTLSGFCVVGPPPKQWFFYGYEQQNLATARAPVYGLRMSGASHTLVQQHFLDENSRNDFELAEIHAYKKDSEEQGGLMTQAQAALVLGVSAPRVVELITAGTLHTFEHFKKRLIGCDQLIAYARLQKLNGNAGAVLLRAFKSVWATSTTKG